MLVMDIIKNLANVLV